MKIYKIKSNFVRRLLIIIYVIPVLALAFPLLAIEVVFRELRRAYSNMGATSRIMGELRETASLVKQVWIKAR